MSLTTVFPHSIIRVDSATPIGDRISRGIGIFILHIVGAAITCTEELVKGSACGAGLDGLFWHHIAELRTATIFAHDTVVNDHINAAFHYLVCCAIFLGHDTATIELANERVIDTPGDVTCNALLIGRGYGAKATAIDIAVGVVFVWYNSLIVSTSEIETGKVSAKRIDSTMACLIFSIAIDMCARGK